MDKTLAGLIGAAGLLATSAQAATAPPLTIGDAMQAQSYADLLKPIPNASALLKASDAAPARTAEPGDAPQAKITPVQWWWSLSPTTPSSSSPPSPSPPPPSHLNGRPAGGSPAGVRPAVIFALSWRPRRRCADRCRRTRCRWRKPTACRPTGYCGSHRCGATAIRARRLLLPAFPPVPA